MIKVATLHLLLVRLEMVEVVKVGHDHGHWKRDGQDTSDGAQHAHNLAPHSYGAGGRIGS